MIFFDILYNILIYPIEFIIEIIFYLFSNVFKSSYAASLFFISLIVNLISLPLYNIAESWQNKERAIQNKMKPMIDNIKSVYKGDKRYLLIRACQRINGYKTIYAFRGTLGLLIQIPFFLAAYNFIHNLEDLTSGYFLFIKDFSKPDGILSIGNFSVNILPIIMTLFSLLSGLVYGKKLKFKESLPLYIVSLIFLVLLYNSPSGLVFYWTLNCLFSLIKNIVIEYKLYRIFVKNKYKILKGYNIFFIILTIVFILIILLSKIEIKAYLSDYKLMYISENNYIYDAKLNLSKIFRKSDLFNIKINIDKLPPKVKNIYYNGINTTVELENSIENFDKIEIYYNTYYTNYTKNIYLFILFISIIINMGNIRKIVLLNNKDVYNLFLINRNKLMIISSLIITILSGLFIPSSLISTSVDEFNNILNLIINSLSMSIGLFLFYPLFLYILFSSKIKDILTLIFIFISALSLIDNFVLGGNYGTLNSDLVFDNANLIVYSSKEFFINILFAFIIFFLTYFLIIKRKSIFIYNLYISIFITLIIISIFYARKIIINVNKLNKTYSYNNQNKQLDDKIFNLSSEGKNIFVFILDRAINSYWLDAFDRFPKYKKDFDGFIIYPNTVSFSRRTITIASLYGGYDYLPYEMSIDGNYNITNFHNEALLTIPVALGDYNYKSSILSPVYANFQGYPNLSIFKDYTNIKAYNEDAIYEKSISNYFSDSVINMDKLKTNNIKNKLLRLSIFKIMPINLRGDFYRNGDWFYHISQSVNTGISSYAILKNVKNLINITNNGNYYNNIHNMTTHETAYFNSDFLPHRKSGAILEEDLKIYKDKNSVKHFYANVSAINLIIDFIKFLKENNIYDNTKIIIVSDHGEIITSRFLNREDTKFLNLYNALLLYKDFNAKGEVKIETNFMTIADTPYLATKHIPNIKNPFNNKLITNDYKNKGVYIIESMGMSTDSQLANKFRFNNFFYTKDNIFDINNWKKFQIDWNTKNAKEIKLEHVEDTRNK